MFIKKLKPGYYRGGEQHSGLGLYLALFAWNQYKAVEEVRDACQECRFAKAAYEVAVADHTMHLGRLSRTCTLHADQHRLEGPLYPNGQGKLWACVRRVSLHQCGHFMMGSLRIGGTRISLSGPIGSDGLPLDLQDVRPAWRPKLIELPQEIAAVYWADDGHNDVGKAAPTLRDWAVTTFLKSKEPAHAQSTPTP